MTDNLLQPFAINCSLRLTRSVRRTAASFKSASRQESSADEMRVYRFLLAVNLSSSGNARANLLLRRRVDEDVSASVRHA